ncbi:leucine-rich repeat-containing protein egg-6-like [Ochlerotatus camptorhynchus]|uniref:leucine-rich repeat-containing protein egg-6-like n=1 Tax=Ochlerotatus camptorhynchus TaxID=644619 RepID=UPI0031CE72F4
MRQLVVLSLIIVIVSTAPPPSTLTCSRQDQDQACHIEGLTLDPSIVFPEEPIIHLDNCTVEDFSPQLAANVPDSTKELSILDGFAPKVFIKPTLKSFTVLRTDTADVQINPEDNFNLEVLDIEGHLRSVPVNVHRLKALVVLDLCENEIEQVDLSQLDELGSLRKVNLGHNNIHSVSLTKELNLPGLEELFLHGNDLTTLDLTHLKADSLQRLYVSQNHLLRIGGFPAPEHNKLTRVDLYLNKWNCEWLESTLRVLNGNGVETLSYLPVTVCNESGSVRVDAIGCE